MDGGRTRIVLVHRGDAGWSNVAERVSVSSLRVTKSLRFPLQRGRVVVQLAYDFRRGEGTGLQCLVQVGRRATSYEYR